MKNYTGKRVSFLIAAVVITLLISAAFSIYSINNYRKSLETVPVFNSVRVKVNPVLNVIKSNYEKIGNYEEFQNNIRKELENIQASLVVVNVNGVILYDNNDKTKISKKVNIEKTVHYDAKFESEKSNNVVFAFPVTVNGIQVANAVFSIPEKDIFSLNNANIILAYAPIYIGTTIVFIVLLILYRSISNKVIKPLSTLNSAIPDILKGNLETKLENFSEGEVGEFTRAFDLMRLELKEAEDRKVKLERERKELVAKISHDIKTPLSYIKAYAEGIRDGIASDPEDSRRYLNVIIEKTNGLTSLVNDLLNHSIQDLGNLRINKEERYSRKLILDIVEPLRLKLAGSSKKLEIDGDIPDVLIMVDAARFEQVFVNLVNNAEKYASADEKIVIKAELEDDCLLISISDNGRGIPPEEIPFIFDSFYRGEQLRESVIEGSGLGLSICKYIVEQHGGNIFAQSIPGKGSIFSFTIPKI